MTRGTPVPTPRRRRWLRLLVQLTIAGVILLTAGTVGFVEYSGQPSFCKNCHNMVPYYESWQTSSHKDVKCILCH
jgi:nitrate/TMAO reductase-like tetraheme cytochrome c subunit